MSQDVISSINLCPINFKAFDAINRVTSNTEATLLYSKIFFHQKNSIIEFDEKTWIIRSRKELALWFLFSEKKIDSLLSLLFKKGLIEKKIRLWKGKRHLMLHAVPLVKEVPVNHKMLETLMQKLGSVSSVIVFAKIAFHYNNSTIQHENKKWCSIKKKHFSDWLNISLRKLDSVIDDLIKTGIILKKNFLWHGKRQLHFHLPNFAIDVISSEIKKNSSLTVASITHTPNQKQKTDSVMSTEQGRGAVSQSNAFKCRYPSAKMGISIINRTNTKKTNNNTASAIKNSKRGDINLISSILTFRQEKYLKTALENTIRKFNLRISNPHEIFEELKFSVTNTEQHKNVDSFTHVVSRFMKILSDKNWKTPKGFYSYSLQGKAIKMKIIQQEENWKIMKNIEQKCSDSTLKNIKINASTLFCSDATNQAMRITNEIAKISHNSDKIKVQNMLDYLHKLIDNGADRNIIANIMRKNINELSYAASQGEAQPMASSPR